MKLEIDAANIDEPRLKQIEIKDTLAEWLPVDGFTRPILADKDIEFSRDGKLKINFPSDFLVPPNWSDLFNGLKFDKSNDANRFLSETSPIEIKIDPVEGQTEQTVAFKYNVTDFTEKYLKIDIDFKNIEAISIEEQPNDVKIHISRTDLFKRSSDNVEIP